IAGRGKGGQPFDWQALAACNHHGGQRRLPHIEAVAAAYDLHRRNRTVAIFQPYIQASLLEPALFHGQMKRCMDGPRGPVQLYIQGLCYRPPGAQQEGGPDCEAHTSSQSFTLRHLLTPVIFIVLRRLCAYERRKSPLKRSHRMLQDILTGLNSATTGSSPSASGFSRRRFTFLPNSAIMRRTKS